MARDVEIEPNAALTSSLLALRGGNWVHVRDGALLRTGALTVRGLDRETRAALVQLTDMNGDGLKVLESYVSGSFAVFSRSDAAAVWGTGSVAAVWGTGSVAKETSNVEVGQNAVLVLGSALPDRRQVSTLPAIEPNEDSPSKANSAVALLRAHLTGDLLVNQFTEFAPGSHFVGPGNLKIRPGFGALFDLSDDSDNVVDGENSGQTDDGVSFHSFSFLF